MHEMKSLTYILYSLEKMAILGISIEMCIMSISEMRQYLGILLMLVYTLKMYNIIPPANLKHFVHGRLEYYCFILHTGTITT